MPKQTVIVKVFVASPNDREDERRQVQNAISDYNSTFSDQSGVHLEYVGWETHASPGIAGYPQEVINNSIGNDYDIFIGILGHRFGQPTPNYNSGTQEEFELARKKHESHPDDVKILFYFCTDPGCSLDEIDANQLLLVHEFRNSLGEKGVYWWPYQDISNFYRLVHKHICKYAQQYDMRLASISATDTSNHTATCNDDTDEDEDGLLDMLDIFTTNMATALASLNNIATALESMNSKINLQNSKLQLTPKVNAHDAKTASSIAADAMTEFVHICTSESKILEEHLDTSGKSLERAIVLFADFPSPDNLDELAQLSSTVCSSREQCEYAAESMREFYDSIGKVPRITTKLNRARKNTQLAAKQLINILTSYGDVLHASRLQIDQLIIEMTEILDSNH